MNTHMPQYSVGEEIANSITHGIGGLLSIVALIFLIIKAAIYGNAWHIVSYTIFGTSLIILYVASTLYHSFSKPNLKVILKKIDHCAIFLLIAGTYTPFLLVNMRGAWGWTLFSIVWSLAITGIIFKLVYIFKFKKLSLTIYLLMGWLCVIAAKHMIYCVPTTSLLLLATGGLLYTIGVIFYVWKKLPYNHAIWHLFVLSGSLLHFFAIYKITMN